MTSSHFLITPTAAREVLHHFGHPGGHPAGSFTEHLLRAMARADGRNLMLLSIGFPDHVAAMRLAMHDNDGIAVLQRIAREGIEK